MSEEQKAETESNNESAEVGLLEKALAATITSPEEETKDLLSVLTSQAMEGSLTWEKNVSVTIDKAVAEIDKIMSKQVAAIMQQEVFKRLEGSWRGLNKLVRESEIGANQKIKLVDYNKEECLEQFEDAPAVDRSPLFEALYQDEFGTAGGEPYGALLGDYYFDFSDEDAALLTYLAETAAACHAPLISAAGPRMFEYEI